MKSLRLTGCRPEPLGSYLKALGIFRLVAEQADAEAHGAWHADTFTLDSRLDMGDLVSFLLEDYRPSLLANPWGGRSGFYPDSSEKAAREALEGLLALEEPRFEPLQESIRAVHALLSDLGFEKKPDSDSEKIRLMQACRARLPDSMLPWLDAVMVLTEEGRHFPPLLGTGGNEGSKSYTSGFSHALLDALVVRPDPARVRAALSDAPCAGVAGDQPPGQFAPDAAGGFNSATGFWGGSITNPWDSILALEGALLFSAAAVRFLQADTHGAHAFPFTVRATGAGYGSSARSDEGHSRGETWMPLWDRPSRLPEIRMLFNEGRAVLGRRAARRGVDFARAVATLGVDRGISRFERYGYLERFGLSTVAVSLGSWEVRVQPAIHLLEEIDPWLDRFRRYGSGDRAPASIARALRRIEGALLALCRRATPGGWQELLVALGDAERGMARSAHSTGEAARRGALSPLPRLSQAWRDAADDGSPELRVACALASIAGAPRSGRPVLPPLRGHMVPLAPGFAGGRAQFREPMDDERVVWRAGSLVDSLVAVLLRRICDTKRHGLPSVPLSGTSAAATADVNAFLLGRLDERRIEGLLWGLNALDWTAYEPRGAAGNGTGSPIVPYCLLKIVLSPAAIARRVGEAVSCPVDPAVFRAAAAGRVDDATRTAARRLRAAGLQVLVDSGFAVSAAQARRIVAAQMIPIPSADVSRMIFDVTRSARA